MQTLGGSVCPPQPWTSHLRVCVPLHIRIVMSPGALGVRTYTRQTFFLAPKGANIRLEYHSSPAYDQNSRELITGSQLIPKGFGMSLDDRRQAELSRKASDAEKSLVLRNFREAEKVSLGLLQNAVYLPKSRVEQQRAACVYLQAIYEDNR